MNPATFATDAIGPKPSAAKELKAVVRVERQLSPAGASLLGHRSHRASLSSELTPVEEKIKGVVKTLAVKSFRSQQSAARRHVTVLEQTRRRAAKPPRFKTRFVREQEFQGRVVELNPEAGEFTATLKQLGSVEEGTATFLISDLSDPQREGLHIGQAFRWVLGRREVTDTRTGRVLEKRGGTALVFHERRRPSQSHLKASAAWAERTLERHPLVLPPDFEQAS